MQDIEAAGDSCSDVSLGVAFTVGNPSGRPKFVPPAHVIANGEELRRKMLGMLNKKIDIVMNGEKISKTVLEAIVQQWIARALNGIVTALYPSLDDEERKGLHKSAFILKIAMQTIGY